MPMTLPVDSPQTARVVDTDRLYEHNQAGKKKHAAHFCPYLLKQKAPFFKS